MRFADELRSPGDIGLPKKPKSPTATVRKFEKLISSKSKKELSPRKLKDEQTEKLLKLVKKKSAKRANVVEVETEKRERGKSDRPDGGVEEESGRKGVRRRKGKGEWVKGNRFPE